MYSLYSISYTVISNSLNQGSKDIGAASTEPSIIEVSSVLKAMPHMLMPQASRSFLDVFCKVSHRVGLCRLLLG